MRFLLLFFCSLILMSGVAHAKPERYSFDKVHSQILFFVDHLGFSNAQGEFHKYDGYIDFDWENPENSEVSITIYADSIDMDYDKWNTHMKSPDFFHIAEYPVIKFKSHHIKVTGKDTAKITGYLKMIGRKEPVTLDVKFNKADIHPYTKKFVAGFSAKTRIKRSDYGMKFAIPAIGNKVDILMEIEAVRDEK